MIFPGVSNGEVGAPLTGGLASGAVTARLERVKASLLGAAELAGKTDWSRGSSDGSFSPGKRRGRKC